MDRRDLLTLGLLGCAVLSGTALALGVGRPPRPENPGVAAMRIAMSEPGRALFTERTCVQCHGADGAGTQLGPGLGAVIQEYLAAAGGDPAGARERLIAYLREPQKVPRLRRDSAKYLNPMPSAKGLGLTDEHLDQLADFLLGMKAPAMAVGGNASER